MKFLSRLTARLRDWNGKSRFEGEMDEELQFHLESMAAENIRNGMSPEDARRRAQIEFGGMDQIKEGCRDTHWIRWIDQLWQDLRFGLRMLLKSPGFTAVAVLTLALGIGANSTIFSAVNGILLKPLPYHDPSRLLTIHREQIAHIITPGELSVIQKQCTTLAHIATYTTRGSHLITGGTGSRQVSAGYVSGDFFSIMGVNPLLGRPIIPDDAQPGNNRVAILSYGLWMEQFGGDTDIVGKSIAVNQSQYTVVGVMPREFGTGISFSYALNIYDGSVAAMWIPEVPPSSGDQNFGYSQILARLKKDATLMQVNAQIQPLSETFALEYAEMAAKIPGWGDGLKLYARKLDPGIQPQVRTRLWILFGAVGFVLLLACVNVASLLIGRTWKREKELVIRRALGATRQRILQQFLAESLLLALLGGMLSLFLSFIGAHLLRVIAPTNTPRLYYIRLEGNVLWFILGVSLLATVLIGLAPAFQSWSRIKGRTFKGLSGEFIGRLIKRPHHLRNTLIVMEILIAFILVVGGTLMAHSFYKLMSVNTGVDARHVFKMSVRFMDPSGKNRVPPGIISSEDILDRIRSIPEVQQAALSSGGPFTGGSYISHYPGSGGIGLFLKGLQGDLLPADQTIIQRDITPEYFNTLGIRLIKGRAFNAEDLTSHAAIVSQSFATKYIPGDPLGKQFNIYEEPNSLNPWMEIVGVVNDVRDQTVEEPPLPIFYSSFSPAARFSVIVKTTNNPMPLVPAIKKAIQSMDKSALISNIATVDQILANSAAESRFQTMLVGSFSVIGLILAIVGIYGVVSYSTVQRTWEISMRMALGGQRKDILRLILREGMLLTLIGIAIGIGGALALTRALRSMLFEIEPTDPETFIGVAIFLTIASLAACYFPARRATKVDPMVTLRHE